MSSGLSTRNKTLVQISDKLRELRFAVRRVGGRPQSKDQQHRHSAIYNLTYAVANASQVVLNSAESNLITFLSTEPEAHSGHADAFGLERYQLATDGDRETLDATRIRFTRDQFFASKRLMLMLGIDNALVQQQRFMDIYQEIAPVIAEKLPSAHRDTQALPPADNPAGQAGTVLDEAESDIDPLAHTAACMTLAILRATPVHSPSSLSYRGFDNQLDINQLLAVALSLVSAVTYNDDEHPDSSIVYTSCLHTALCKSEDIQAALEKTHPIQPLKSVFLKVINHLP